MAGSIVEVWSSNPNFGGGAIRSGYEFCVWICRMVQGGRPPLPKGSGTTFPLNDRYQRDEGDFLWSRQDRFIHWRASNNYSTAV